MPFTLSHVAAVLPLLRPVARVPYAASALVIGSMVPDTAMFVPGWPGYDTTHSVTGILTVDTLATCSMVVVFHLLFRAPLTALLPASAGRRIPSPPPLRRPVLLLLVPPAAAVGAATHTLWDSFTHARSSTIWGWQWLTATPVAGLTAYHLLQYASTVIGLLAVVGWSLLKLRGLPAAGSAPRMPSAVRVAVWAALTAVTAGCAALWPTRLHQPRSFASAVFWTGMGALTGLVVTLTVYCAAFILIKILAGTPTAAPSAR
ncbi:hypothetical protein F4553_003029 [Allocatelliglobosispora scoriae]|uniref:DUF4184 family protein n=1 Tax=Allocatelliglobosispora scoriae TaxID=643052 RepID=A0A841BS76_9ACTN|nr:DUF4184 family protein [Allocatelliglobosispora scoriae]MBB5869650.1 hypothetical protein [Allocatelliglobosispora scoriae]